MPFVNEYGRRLYRPPQPPQPPKPPQGQGKPLGNRPEDYGTLASPNPPASPSSPPGKQALGGSWKDYLTRGETPATTFNPNRPDLTPEWLQAHIERGDLRATPYTPAPPTPAPPRQSLGNRPEDYGTGPTQLAQGQSPTATATASAAQSALRTFTGGGTGSTGAANSQPAVINTTSGGPTAQAAATATPSESASPTGTDILSSVHQDLVNELGNIGNETDAAIATKSQYYQQLMDLIEQTRKDLIAQSEKDGKELDPSTLLTLDRLKQDAQEGLKSVREVANRRGILDSGIALSMEQDVNKAYGQQEAQVLSDRLSRIRDNLQTGLRQLSGQAIDVQQRKVADLSSLQDKFLAARQTARERAQQRQDTWQQYQMDRADRQAAQAAQNALRYSELTGSVVTPVSQADSMLAEAKRRYNEAKARNDKAGMDAAAEMGRQARALGPTLDPNNTMSYDQIQGAIQSGQSVYSQVRQGSPTAAAAQAALRSATTSSRQQASSNKLGVVQDLASLDVDPETANLTVGEKRQMADYMLTQALVNGEITLDEYYAGQKERDSRWPVQKDQGDAIPSLTR